MSVRLFVLGILYGRDSHGYEINETAKLWGVARWANIQEGSIYHALTKLKQEHLIQEHPTELSENNRPRFVYNITEKGKQSFLALLRETCRTASVEKRDIDIALAFLDFLPSAERLELLQERHNQLHREHAALLEGQARTQIHYPNIRPWVAMSVQHSIGRIEFEIEWNTQLLAAIGEWKQRYRV